MIIASDPASNFSRPAIEHLKRIPVITLDPKTSVTSQLARVAFTTATYGINVPGTVYRMDNVPISLRPAFESPYPSDEQILTGRSVSGCGPCSAATGSRPAAMLAAHAS